MALATVPYVPCTCIYCGKLFHVKPSEARRGRGKACAVRCPGRTPKQPKRPRPTLVRLEKLRPGDEFYIDNRRGVVLARHLLFDAVRVKMDNRIHLWHRAILCEPIPEATGSILRADLSKEVAGCQNGQQSRKSAPTRGTNGQAVPR